MEQDEKVSLWTAIDRWFAARLIGADDILDHVLAESERAGLRSINVTPGMGRLLMIFARMIGARNILEIGTLGGYSGIWMARALPPEGRLITLEADPDNAAVARSNIAHAGLDKIIEVRVGKALDTLPALAAEKPPPFDLVFIDADKQNNPGYFEWALELTRPGSLIIIDNVVRSGYVLDDAETDRNILGVRRVTEMIAATPSVIATVVQTVGEKGHDGFLVALVQPG
jgi:predicted O-methyltransferase YrrM